MNPRFLDKFINIQPDNSPKLHKYSRILIIDGINSFVRGFSATNTHNYQGNHVGGITGTLTTIASAVRLINPTSCFVVFDGEAGSQNRKYLYPEYKANRINSAHKISNYKSFNSKPEEDRSKHDQMTRLVDYLKLLPVNCVCVDKLEADDIIGFMTTKFQNEYTDSEIYIMSSDQDFFQLINDRVTVWSPTKKLFFKTKDVLDNFGVHPENFILYKTLIGDTSDNIPGIDGFGEKTTPKLIEILKDDTRHYLNDLYEVCSNPPSKSKLYERVLGMKRMVEIFYKLMNLREPNISDDAIEDINSQIYTKTPSLKRHDILRLCNEDYINIESSNIERIISSFSFLNCY